MARKTRLRRIVVNVTAADIQKGRRKSGLECPLARALYRTTDSACQVGAAVAFIGIGRGHPSALYDLSKPAREFVDRFDIGGRKRVRPAKFVLTERKP